MSNIAFPEETPNKTLSWTDRVLIDDWVEAWDVLASEFLDTDNHTDWTINKVFTATEKTKLSNIEEWAEENNISDVNATDLTDWWDTSLHIHDSRYYTETETNTLLDDKQDVLAEWAFVDWDKTKLNNVPSNIIAELADKIDKTTNVDNTIMRANWINWALQDSKFTIDDDWNIIPTEDWTQEIWTDSLPIKDFHLKDENWLVITWRKLWGLHRDYNERASFLPFLISCDVTAWVWTCTLTDNSWSWYLAFGLDDKDLRTTWSTLSVDATAFAWTDLNPKTVYLYVQNNWTDVPELVASNTEPSDATAHVNIARYKTGTVSTSSVNIYWKIDSIVQSYEITKNVHFRAFNDWPRYQSWLLPVATSTDLTVWVWSYLLIFDKITTIQKQVSVDWLFYIKGDWTYWESTTFDFDWEYWDWVTIWNNKYFNVVIWIVEDDTTRIMWIVQDWTTEEYISFDGALADEYEQTVYYPNDDFLKNIFVPIARIIVKNTGWTYTLQQFPDWNYFKDLRGIRQAGWWGWWWTTSNVLDWNTDNDFAVWDAIDWEYKPKTIAEVKTLLDLSLYQLILAEWAFVDWDKTKLDWIDENANNYSLPISSTTVLWWVKIDWTTITISDWVISSTTGGWWWDTINEETLTWNKTLTVWADDNIQLLNTGWGSRNITLSLTWASEWDTFYITNNASAWSYFFLNIYSNTDFIASATSWASVMCVYNWTSWDAVIWKYSLFSWELYPPFIGLQDWLFLRDWLYPILWISCDEVENSWYIQLWWWTTTEAQIEVEWNWTNIDINLKPKWTWLVKENWVWLVHISWNETVAWVKTFSSFLVTPSLAPTSDYQVTNKKYVDDKVTIESDPTWITGADQVINVVSLTQTEYDAITTPNASTLYIITT